MAAKTKPGIATIDDYLDRLDDDQRAALERLRTIIKAAAPKAEECISYQTPAFRLNGMLVGLGARSGHCALYLMSAATVANHQKELAGYDTSKGTIRFQADRPLPRALVRKLVKARVAEQRGDGKTPKTAGAVGRRGSKAQASRRSGAAPRR